MKKQTIQLTVLAIIGLLTQACSQPMETADFASEQSPIINQVSLSGIYMGCETVDTIMNAMKFEGGLSDDGNTCYVQKAFSAVAAGNAPTKLPTRPMARDYATRAEFEAAQREHREASKWFVDSTKINSSYNPVFVVGDTNKQLPRRQAITVADYKNPEFIFSGDITFNLEDQRSVYLSGSASALSSISLDTVLVVRIDKMSNQAFEGSKAIAFGPASAANTSKTVNNVQFQAGTIYHQYLGVAGGSVAWMDSNIPLRSELFSGNSSAGAIDLADYYNFEPGFRYIVHLEVVTALGARKSLSNVYLIIK